MKTVDIVLIVIWIFIAIEIIVFIITNNLQKERQLLNHRPTYRYPYEEAYFVVKNIEYVDIGLCKYTLTVSFFKKEDAKKWIFHEFYLYDKNNKYNVGDKLYLNKKQ